MKQSSFNKHIKLLNALPVAVLVLNHNYAECYSNSHFSFLMSLASAEFGDISKATKSFIGVCKLNRNKSDWLMRINADKPGSVVCLRILRSEFSASEDLKMIVHTITSDSKTRKHEVSGAKIFLFGALRVDSANESVYFGRKVLPTSATEFRLLFAFCEEPDTLLTKESLLKNVWQKRALNTRTLDVYVSRLNRRLRLAGGPKYIIRPVHSRGYIFDSYLLEEN